MYGLKKIRQHRIFGSIVILLSSLLVAANLQTEVGQSVASRFATIDSLVHHSTWRISDSMFNSYVIDKVKNDGEFYSTKPPLLPALGSVVYYAWVKLTGDSFQTQLPSITRMLNVVFGLLPWFALLVVFRRVLSSTDCSATSQRAALVCFAFGYLGIGYSTEFNNHIPGALALLGSFHLFDLSQGRQYAPSRIGASGICAGLAIALDPSCLPFAVAMSIYAYLARNARAFVLFSIGLLIPVLLSSYLLFVATGSILPIYARVDAYLYPDSYWSNPQGMDALNESKWIFIFHSIFGHHGYLSMSPILFLGLYQQISDARRKGLRSVDALLLIGFVVLVSGISLVRSNYGGLCVGFRWLLVAAPIHFYYVARWMDQTAMTSGLRRCLVFGLLAISAANAGNALAYPYQQSFWFQLLQGIGLAPIV